MINFQKFLNFVKKFKFLILCFINDLYTSRKLNLKNEINLLSFLFFIFT